MSEKKGIKKLNPKSYTQEALEVRLREAITSHEIAPGEHLPELREEKK